MTDLILQLLCSVLLGFGVFMLVWSLFRYPVAAEPPVQRRIAAALGAEQPLTLFDNPTLQPILNLALAAAVRLSLPGLRHRIFRGLNASGNPSGYSVNEYLALCLVCGIGLSLVSAISALALGGPAVLILATFMAAMGFFAPIAILDGAAKRRMTRISKQLPYTLDLLSLMMSAGATFTEALDTIIRDDPDEPLIQELGIVRAEVEFGSNRATGMRNMAERIPLDSVRSVVGAINQAEALGTPLSAILKIQADMIRSARSVRAEKLSASASLRILIPSMLILIAVVVTVFGPMIVRWATQGSLY